MTVRPFVLLVALASLGCKEESETPQTRGSSEPAKQPEPVAEKAPTEPAVAEPEPEKPAEGGDETPAAEGAVTGCPTSLGGRETADRTIGKECGVVTVTGNYAIDGATLTLQAGATLAFNDGAELSIGYYEPAKLVVEGTKADPVVLTSAGDKAPGVWKGVRLYPKASRSSIEGLVIEYAGDGKGALLVEGQDVVVKGSTIRHVKDVALEATVKGSFAAFEGNAFEVPNAVALRLPPQLVGGIGPDNRFDPTSRVHVTAGTVEDDATWRALPVPYVAVGEVRVDGKEGARAQLTIAAGANVLFDGDARLSIGYYAEGALFAKGSAGAHVVFGAHNRPAAGSWRGIAIHGHGEAELEHVELRHGGKREAEGVLLADNRSRVTVKDCTFSTNTSGIVLRGAEVEAVAIDGNRFESTPLAIRLPARQVGALGPGNTYDADARVVIEGGKTGKDAKWVPQKGARVELDGNLAVDGGTLEIASGYTLVVGDGVGIDVGYYESAALRMLGTASEPIRLVGTRDDAGTWKSIVFHKNAHGNELRHVQLANAGGEAGVVFKRDSDGNVDAVTCDPCSGTPVEVDPKANVVVK